MKTVYSFPKQLLGCAILIGVIASLHPSIGLAQKPVFTLGYEYGWQSAYLQTDAVPQIVFLGGFNSDLHTVRAGLRLPCRVTLGLQSGWTGREVFEQQETIGELDYTQNTVTRAYRLTNVGFSAGYEFLSRPRFGLAGETGVMVTHAYGTVSRVFPNTDTGYRQDWLFDETYVGVPIRMRVAVALGKWIELQGMTGVQLGELFVLEGSMGLSFKIGAKS